MEDDLTIRDLIFEDETDQYAEAVLDGLKGSEAITSCLWPLEVVRRAVEAEGLEAFRPR